MTEPGVASSDATTMEATAVVDGYEMVVNGRKWWSTGVGNPDCRVLVFMGLTNPDADRHHRHSMVLVRSKRSCVRSIIVFDAPTSAWRMARDASTSRMMPTFTSIK